MIRVTLIGAGAHSRNHGASLKILRARRPDEIELAAVCDLVADRARAYADMFGFARTYTDIDTMLAQEKPDCVMAIVPIPALLEVGAKLLRTGIPVVLEKTPGKDSGETRELLRVARECGTGHMVSFNRRFNPGVVRAREWLAANADRPPKVAVGRLLRSRRNRPMFAVNTGIHCVDTLLSLVGTPERVACDRLPTRHEGIYVFDARVNCSNGAVADFILSPLASEVEETYELYGDGYSVKVDAFTGAMRVADVDGQITESRPRSGAPDAFTNGTLRETKAFLDAVAAGEGFGPDLEEALLSMLTAEAILRGGETEIRA